MRGKLAQIIYNIRLPFSSEFPPRSPFPAPRGPYLNLLAYKRSATAASPATHGLTLQTLHFLGNLFHGKLEKPRQDDGRGRVLYCLRRRTLIRSDPNKRIRPYSVQTPGNSVGCTSYSRIVSACLAPVLISNVSLYPFPRELIVECTG